VLKGREGLFLQGAKKAVEGSASILHEKVSEERIGSQRQAGKDENVGI